MTYITPIPKVERQQMMIQTLPCWVLKSGKETRL